MLRRSPPLFIAVVLAALAASPAWAQGPPAGPTVVPSQLPPEEAAFLDQLLGAWEQESDKINNYECSFEQWQYDPAWGPGEKAPKTKSTGVVKYVKPDKGRFEITEIRHYDPQTGGWKAREGEPLPKWVCDGKAVYEFDAVKKEVGVHLLPPELQGKAIADGPLPFLFGAKKDKLKARYFLRVDQVKPTEIWLRAYPRFQNDAANFSRVELILNRENFLPSALQIYMPNGKERTVYMFAKASVNNPLQLFAPLFQQPRTPFGWKKVIHDGPPPVQRAEPGTAGGFPGQDSATARPVDRR